MSDTKIEVENGKYSFVVSSGGEVGCERFGEPWIVFDKGGKALIALIYGFSEAQNKIKGLEIKLAEAVKNASPSDSLVLIEQARLCCHVEIPKTFSETNALLWKAFNLGKEYRDKGGTD